MNRILFVCLGNICRSPAAEAIFRKRAADRGMPAIAASAGAGGWHKGKGADMRMVRAAARRGYMLQGHCARQVSLADFYEFDFLLAMDIANQADLLAMAPPNRECDIRLFLDFAGGAVRETPDPYYGGEDGFERVLDLIEGGVDAFLDHLERSG
jgi:protein-tyrosine phosphatase